MRAISPAAAASTLAADAGRNCRVSRASTRSPRSSAPIRPCSPRPPARTTSCASACRRPRPGSWPPSRSCATALGPLTWIGRVLDGDGAAVVHRRRRRCAGRFRARPQLRPAACRQRRDAVAARAVSPTRPAAQQRIRHRLGVDLVFTCADPLAELVNRTSSNLSSSCASSSHVLGTRRRPGQRRGARLASGCPTPAGRRSVARR